MSKSEIVRTRVEANIRAALDELSRQRMTELSDTARVALATYIETTINELELTANALGDTPRANELRTQAEQLRAAYNAAQTTEVPS